MKYTPELTAKIVQLYEEGTKGITSDACGKSSLQVVAEIVEYLKPFNLDAAGTPSEVPERSIIAKLSSLGVYKKKEYLTKRGEIPVKKEEYIDRIAVHLDVNVESLESLEKVNKHVLILLDTRLRLVDNALLIKQAKLN